ncbi:heterokaryon incompatibility protein-domain-containing protein [Xylaria castorea]|nr:heterokaryon incompatibility protein-domain-containing protein [Xylaria castorea]
MDTFEYQQIDLKSSAFRLVRLLKADFYEDAVECELVHTTLDENVIPYEAVSYTWDTSFKARKIKVHGLNFLVTSNLWNLLCDLRPADTDRYLWIDAISINQDDDLERGHQVRRMQVIYGSAERVLCYVGETTENISIFMTSLSAFQRRASGYRWEPNDSRWESIWERAQLELRMRYGNNAATIQKRGLRELLERPSFRRVWVLQEVASARKASLCCGRNSVSLPIFATSTNLLGVDLDSHSRAVLKLMPTYSRKAQPGTGHGHLYQILVDFRESEASEPHDKIFALLGLCGDQYVWETVVPDYTQTESALVCATIAYIMTKSLGTPPEWLSLVHPPPIFSFLDDLANAIHYEIPMNTRHVKGRDGVNTHIADTAVLDRPIVFEMMSLLLKYGNGLNLNHIRSNILGMTSQYWNDFTTTKVSVYILIHSYLLEELKIILELSVRPPSHVVVPGRRKEVYRFLSLTSGPYLNNVVEQRSVETTKISGRELQRYMMGAEVLEKEISTRLTDTDRYDAGGFEDWAFFTMAVTYGRMWTEKDRLFKKQLLVKKPVGFDQCGISDAMALYSAIHFQHELATRRLLDKGVEIVIGQLPNPLSLAVHHNSRAIMDVLRAYPTNIVGYDGRFPLHCAAELETIPVILFLLEQGADPGAVDRDGRTALQVAKDSGRPGVVRLLEAVIDDTVNYLDRAAADAVEVTIAMNKIANWVDVHKPRSIGNRSIDYFEQDSFVTNAKIGFHRQDELGMSSRLQASIRPMSPL